MADSPLDIAFRLLTVGLLVAANAFFVAAEFSLVTIRRTRVEQLVAERHPVARSLRRATSDPTIFIAATQLGVTMASLAVGWIGEPTVAGLVEPAFHALPPDLARAGAHSVAVALAFAFITGIHVVLGELVPKSLALQHAERTALLVAEPMRLFAMVLRPLIWLFGGAGGLVLSAIGAHPAPGHRLVHSVEELKMLVSASRQAGVLDPGSEEMVDRVFDFAELRAHHVMTPRTEVKCVELGAGPEEALRLMVEVGHSRLPVYQGDLDNVVGVVHLRDLLQHCGLPTPRPGHLRHLMREPLVLPESLPATDLLAELRRRKTHIAILVDEYGGTAGLVTFRDLLDRLVGEVRDEFAQSRVDVQPLPDGALVDGLVTLEEVNDALGLSLSDEDYDTIGGFVVGRLGRMAVVGDVVDLEDIQLRVEALDGRRVAAVRVVVSPAPSGAGEASREADGGLERAAD